MWKWVAAVAFAVCLGTGWWAWCDRRPDTLAAFGAALVAFLAAVPPLVGEVRRPAPLPPSPRGRTGIRAKSVQMSGQSSIANQDLAVEAHEVKMTGSSRIE